MDFDEELLEEIKKREYLYNKKMKLYRNNDLRAKAWEDIAKKLKTEEQICRTRWRTLRDRFCKEIGRARSGSGLDDLSPKWVLLENMLFLKDHVASRKTISNYKVDKVIPATSPLEEISCEPFSEMISYEPFTEVISYEPLTEGDSPAPATPIVEPSTAPKAQQTSKRRRKNAADSIDDNFSSFVGRMDHMISAICEPKPKNKHSSFLEMVSEKLDQLPDNLCEDIKMEMLNWLHDKVVEHKCSS